MKKIGRGFPSVECFRKFTIIAEPSRHGQSLFLAKTSMLYIYIPLFFQIISKLRKVWAKRVRIIDIDFRPNFCNPSPAMLTSFIIK